MKKYYYLFIFLFPAVALVFVFYLLPNLLNFYYSFTDWSGFSSDINFNGLENFARLFRRGYIFDDIIITLKYAFFVTILQNGTAFILALALEKTTRINGFFRTIFFLPVLFSSLAAGYIFRAILQPDGPVNTFLTLITGTEVNFPYLGHVTWSIFFVACIHAWRFMGINLLVFIAGLNAIPEEVIESASVDGASYLNIVKNIKIPLLGPALTFNIVTTSIITLATLEVVLASTRGGPARSTEVLTMFIYKEFATGLWGYTVSINFLLFLIIAFLAIPMIVLLRKREVQL